MTVATDSVTVPETRMTRDNLQAMIYVLYRLCAEKSFLLATSVHLMRSRQNSRRLNRYGSAAPNYYTNKSIKQGPYFC